MNKFPKIKSIKPQKDKFLLISFDNGIQKKYDCKPILKEEIFSPLTNDSFFKSVKVDNGGYGISWNDEIDLSESELWINGI